MTSHITKQQAIETLKGGGIFHPMRLVKLIKDTIAFFELNLSGLTVLTEAASGAYVVTPIIAATAGAKRVLALTRDSVYASASAVIAQTRALELLCCVSSPVEINTSRSLDLFACADIVTNLGFVRPIDAEAVAAMKPTASVSLMCEAWEYRPADTDLEACKAKGISVLGTNENYPGLEVFSYSGWLCLKMLFDAQIEIHKSRILIVSSDKFGQVIQRQLNRSGALSKLYASFHQVSGTEFEDTDVIVVADYTRQDEIIGPQGDISPIKLVAKTGAHVCIIQFAGQIDVEGLRAAGMCVYPGSKLGARRMARTLADIGPRAVVELHAAGLKVGEISVRVGSAISDVMKKMPSVTGYSKLVQALYLKNSEI